MTALQAFAMPAIMSGITVALILLFKKLAGHRLSPFFHYYIWLLLVVRLLFPVLPQSRLSLYNIFENYTPLAFNITADESDAPSSGTPDAQSGVQDASSSGGAEAPRPGGGITGGSSPANRYGVINRIETAPAPAPVKPDFSDNTAVFMVWAAVSVCVLILGLFKYVIQRRPVLRRVLPCLDAGILREAEFILASYKIKRRIDIYWGERSMLLGVFHPAVIIDKRWMGGDHSRRIEMILAHELTHLYRRDNIKNFFYGALACLYWFNPLVYYAFTRIHTDAELLCDYTALNRFGLSSGEYAELLCDSVHKGSLGGSPSAAPAMSRAGRQLIQRLGFISKRKHHAGMPLRILCAVVATVIAALCLTNPVAATKNFIANENYMIKFRELLSDTSLDFPDGSVKLTVRGFINSVLLALDSADLPLEVSRRLRTMRSAGADYLLQEMIKTSYSALAPRLYGTFIESIDPDAAVTREQAVFLLNCLLLLVERDTLIIPGALPALLSQTDYEDTMEQFDNENARRKFSAFFSLKSVYTIDNNGSRVYDSDIASHSLIENSPLCVIFPYYSLDPFASRRERNMLLDYLDQNVDFHGYQLLASFSDAAEYNRFISSVPPLLSNAISSDSFNNNLLGSITDPALKNEIAALYTPEVNPTYADTVIYVLSAKLDPTDAAALTLRLLEHSSYTYAMMARDQAMCGFDYISLANNILPMRDYSFTRTDGSEAVYSVLSKKEYEYLYSLVTPAEQRILDAYFILKDPHDLTLDSIRRKKIAETFRIDTAVYIFDPEATQPERAAIDAIITKYATDYTSVYALPVREYLAFQDETQIDRAALTAVRCMQSYGVIDADALFEPYAAVTFADAVEMIVRLYSVMVVY